MKVTFLSPILNELRIVVQIFEFDESPKIGDSIGLMDFINEQDKVVFANYCQKENKSEHPIVQIRSWQYENNESVLYAHLEHITKEVKPFVF